MQAGEENSAPFAVVDATPSSPAPPLAALRQQAQSPLDKVAGTATTAHRKSSQERQARLPGEAHTCSDAADVASGKAGASPPAAQRRGKAKWQAPQGPPRPGAWPPPPPRKDPPARKATRRSTSAKSGSQRLQPPAVRQPGPPPMAAWRSLADADAGMPALRRGMAAARAARAQSAADKLRRMRSARREVSADGSTGVGAQAHSVRGRTPPDGGRERDGAGTGGAAGGLAGDVVAEWARDGLHRAAERSHGRGPADPETGLPPVSTSCTTIAGTSRFIDASVARRPRSTTAGAGGGRESSAAAAGTAAELAGASFLLPPTVNFIPEDPRRVRLSEVALDALRAHRQPARTAPLACAAHACDAPALEDVEPVLTAGVLPDGGGGGPPVRAAEEVRVGTATAAGTPRVGGASLATLHRDSEDLVRMGTGLTPSCSPDLVVSERAPPMERPAPSAEPAVAPAPDTEAAHVREPTVDQAHAQLAGSDAAAGVSAMGPSPTVPAALEGGALEEARGIAEGGAGARVLREAAPERDGSVGSATHAEAAALPSVQGSSVTDFGVSPDSCDGQGEGARLRFVPGGGPGAVGGCQATGVSMCEGCCGGGVRVAAVGVQGAGGGLPDECVNQSSLSDGGGDGDCAAGDGGEGFPAGQVGGDSDEPPTSDTVADGVSSSGRRMGKDAGVLVEYAQGSGHRRDGDGDMSVHVGGGGSEVGGEAERGCGGLAGDGGDGAAAGTPGVRALLSGRRRWAAAAALDGVIEHGGMAMAGAGEGGLQGGGDSGLQAVAGARYDDEEESPDAFVSGRPGGGG